MSSYLHTKKFEHPDGGDVYALTGPGMPQHANEVVVWREHDAETIARLLSLAFRAGQLAKEREVRNVLGLQDTPWGLKTS